MSFEPCHIEYDLSRRQRLAIHLGRWLPTLPGTVFVVGVGIVSAHVLSSLVSRWFLVFWVVPLWAGGRWFWGFPKGLLNVVFVPLQHMDIIVEETGLGFLVKGERFWVFLDGIRSIERHCEDTWTILHRNGTVINIPVAAIDERYIDHMRTMAEKRKTPEGKQAVLERGRLIAALEAEERQERKETKRQAKKEEEEAGA
jgi:hypothetical protein